MKTRPIDEARSADLRGSWPALLRAARRARELAVQTGTALVIERNGIIEHIYPKQEDNAAQLQESAAAYKDKA